MDMTPSSELLDNFDQGKVFIVKILHVDMWADKQEDSNLQEIQGNSTTTGDFDDTQGDKIESGNEGILVELQSL